MMADTSADTSHAAPAPSAPERVLDGIRVLDLGGIGPGPYASMLLADQGAHVIRIHRPKKPAPTDAQAAAQAEAGSPRRPESLDDLLDSNPVLDRGKHSLAIDIKDPAGLAAVKALAQTVDAVIEGFRPGVAERLGLGPADLMAANPKLVYGRITGWGQSGPLAQTAGHDMTYVAATGVLSRLGRAGGAPQVPVNLLGDFGGGGMQLAFGITAALTRAARTGLGSVVNAAMVDGVNHLWSMMHGFEALGAWTPQRGSNLLDGAAPFYDIYPTADGQYVSVGCLEKPFFDVFVTKLGLADKLPEPLEGFKHMKPRYWPQLRELFSSTLAQLSAAELAELFEGTDACVAVILDTDTAEAHPHNVERALFYRDAAGVRQPAPTPRFHLGGTASLTSPVEAGFDGAADPVDNPANVHGGQEPYVQPAGAPTRGDSTDRSLAEAGLSPEQIADLRARGVVS